MPLHVLSYQSIALHPLSDAQMRGLLAKARTFNTVHQISGLLLYRQGQFTQVLEGEEAVLRALYEKIERDPRHTNLVKLSDAPLAQRNFGAWAMAYRH